jgi:hypothetical protein
MDGAMRKADVDFYKDHMILKNDIKGFPVYEVLNRSGKLLKTTLTKRNAKRYIDKIAP